MDKPNHWHRREKLRQYLYTYMCSNSCRDCGESDPVVLQLDHQHSKRYDMSKAIRNRIGIKTLQTEIEKCHVVCANCHMRRTAAAQNWYTRLV